MNWRAFLLNNLMISFKQFFLEYRHDLADGTPSQSIQPDNGKRADNIGSRKHSNTLAKEYEELNPKAHTPGAIFTGTELLLLLGDYNWEFQEGKTHKLKNSPWGLTMYRDPQGEAVGRIIQVKPLSAK